MTNSSLSKYKFHFFIHLQIYSGRITKLGAERINHQKLKQITNHSENKIARLQKCFFSHTLYSFKSNLFIIYLIFHYIYL